MNILELTSIIVGESIYKPHKLDESKTIFTLNMNKNYKNRVRKVDVERQQEMLKKAQMQGQGAIIQKSTDGQFNNGNDSLAIISNSN